MMTPRFLAAAATACLFSLPGSALAEASRLHLILGGEAYDGPPRFEVSFNGQVLGEGVVEAAIDTATAGRFADAADKTPYVQSFEFAIPEELFKPGGEVRVRLVNEAYGGEGSNRDRNLYLAAVAVNGDAVTVSGLTTATPKGFKENELIGEFLVLHDGNEQGVSAAPRGGWPMPAPTTATSPEPAGAAKVEVEVEEAGAPEPAMTPVPGIRPVKSPVVAEVEQAEPELTASIDQDPGVNPSCALDELFNVVGFNENSNDLTPRVRKRLDQILAAIGSHQCTIQVTGYSSTQGAYATNALFAIERAQNVLRYLKEAGLKFAEASATGAGETTQFGEELSANRRVVITVTP